MLFIRKYIRLFRSLSGPAHSVILLATLVSPLAVDFLVSINDFRWCWQWSCFEWTRIFGHIVMWLISVGVIAKAANADWSRMEKKFNAMSSDLNDGINELRQDHDDKIIGVGDRVGDLQRWAIDTRNVVLQETGISLPRIPISLRGKAVATGATSASGELTVNRRASGWRATLRHWFIDKARRFSSWIKKWVLGFEGEQS